MSDRRKDLRPRKKLQASETDRAVTECPQEVGELLGIKQYYKDNPETPTLGITIYRRKVSLGILSKRTKMVTNTEIGYNDTYKKEAL